MKFKNRELSQVKGWKSAAKRKLQNSLEIEDYYVAMCVMYNLRKEYNGSMEIFVVESHFCTCVFTSVFFMFCTVAISILNTLLLCCEFVC